MLFPLWPWKLRGKQVPLRNRGAKSPLALEILEDRLALSTTLVSHDQWRLERYSVDEVAVADALPIAGIGQQTVQGVAGQGSSFGSLIHLDKAFASYSYRGEGYSVAVIDTGIDYKHADLGGAWGKRVIAGYDFVNHDADPMDDNGHGTHVAGIIGSSSTTYSGVAPKVNLIALKVLGADGSGSFGDVEDALQWVVDHQAQYNIVAVNMSLGSGNYTVNPYDFLEGEFTALKSEGVFISVASGNGYYANGSKQGLAYPAISPQAVSVGAVWTGDFGKVSWGSGAIDYTTAADRITSFTQRGPGLGILAPGALITSTYLGGGYQTMAGTSMASPVVAGAAAILHQALDMSGHHAQANQDYILGLMKSTGASVNDGDDENDNVTNTGLNFKRLDIFAALNSITVVNLAPTLSPIPNQTMWPGQPLVVSLLASDPNGDPIHYSGRVVAQGASGSQAYQLKQQLGLTYAGSYYANAHGMNEKWMIGAANEWYCLLPNGQLRHWAGTTAATLGSAALIATLAASFYADPSLLWNAQPPTSAPVTLSFVGNQLTVQAPASFRGSFTVEVSASDGALSATRTFTVTVVNRAPLVGALANQTMPHGQDKLTLTVPVSDPDGDPVTFTALAYTTDYNTFALDRQLGLTFLDSYYENSRGLGEKWLFGTATGKWYFILPSGELRQWNGSSAAASPAVATLDTAYFRDPSLLYNPKTPATVAVGLTVQGNQLTIDPPASLVGTFTVEITASDGEARTTKSFNITVVNHAPTLGAIANQTLTHGQLARSIVLTGADADGDAVSYAAVAYATDPTGYLLKQELGLTLQGHYFENSRGLGERWLFGTVTNKWYFILPNGEMHEWNGSGAATSPLFRRLDTVYFQDPSRLWNAGAPQVVTGIASVQGSTLTLNAPADLPGTYWVQVTASDGAANSRQTLALTIK